jgi:hypothetical protein
VSKYENFSPGIVAYNLACVCSLEDEPEECRQWLIKSRDSGNLPERSHLEQDTDLDPVRDLPWFKEFLETLRK